MVGIIFAALGGVLVGFVLMFVIGIELRLLRPRANDGIFMIDETNPEDVKMKLEFDITSDELVNRKIIYLKVDRRE